MAFGRKAVPVAPISHDILMEKQNEVARLARQANEAVDLVTRTINDLEAWKNHGQSLSQLAQRGGLSWAEALAIIEGKNWRDAEHNENTAEVTVRKMVAEYVKG